MQLVSGQKIALNQLIQNDTKFELAIQFSTNFDVDISSFGIGLNDTLYHDDYMTFYNQPQTPKGEVELNLEQKKSSSISAVFHFDLSKIDPNQIPRFVICATVANAHSTMREIQNGQIDLIHSSGQVVATYPLNTSSLIQEKALMLIEIYFKSNVWRMAAIGQGFNGGLKALVEHFGGDVAETVTTSTSIIPPVHASTIKASTPVANASSIDLKKKIVLDKIEKEAPHLIDLAKKSLLSLEKNKLLNVKARVALILDYSGSMNKQYKNGDVQSVLDRIMPLAVNFDDDGSFECWAFAEKPLRLSDVSLKNLNQYIETESGGHKYWKAGARFNNEPAVLKTVLEYFTQESCSDLPVYVVFISDGGVSETKKIKHILKYASKQPIFWQFVGIGGRHYGVLEQLDTMDGREVDNCNFFEMDNIQSMPEAQLYDLLLQEFPLWLKDAKAKNIVKK